MLLWKGRLEVQSDEGTEEHKLETKRLEIVSRCLMAGNDLQMVQGKRVYASFVASTDTSKGTALIITGLSSSYTMSLYHLHLVYDTVSCVA